MHELSIALSVLEMAEEEAARRGNVSVAAIHIKLGPLAGVIKQALASAYDVARECTSLAECELIVDDMPLIVTCGPCGATLEARSVQDICCPNCGSVDVKIVAGRELEVSALEIIE
ncbi:MAG TPA: hydrogenase maturation nickel metallochaperone HypA [Pirellulales bacterium]|nr:hydrogenase maturation nickel metallochaperone HypA [Pirellulales bacterium]